MSTGHAVRLGDLCTFVRGINFKPEDVVPIGTPDSVACLRTKNVQAQVDLRDVWAVGASFVKRKEQFLQQGDILISSANSWNLVGKGCWIPQLPWRASFGGFVSVLRANPAIADPRYVFHWFTSERVQTTVRSFGQQTTNISNLNTERCLNLPVPLPQLSEQHRIARILDRADALRAKRREAISKVSELLHSSFVEIFGDPLTNPKRWSTKEIKEIGRVVTGNTPPRARPEYYGNAIEWIKSDNLNTPQHIASRSDEGLSEAGIEIARIAPAGAVLVTCIAGTPACIGNAALVDRSVAFNQQINALIPEIGDVRFLYSQICIGKQLVQNASTASMKGMVSKSRFENVRLMFPPLELQQQFGEMFTQLEALAERQRASLTELDALFASLQHRAFRGEL